MSDQLSLEINARNELLAELQKTIPALEKIKEATDSQAKAEKELGKSIADQFSKSEKAIAKELEMRMKQKDATVQLAAVVEKVNAANKTSGTEAVKALGGLKQNEAELKRIYAELQKLDAKGAELIKNVSAAASAGNASEVERLLAEFKNGLDPEQAAAFADEFTKAMGEVENSIGSPVAELRRLRRELAAGVYEGEELVLAKERAAELEEAITNTNKEIKNLADGGRVFEAGLEAIEAGVGVFSAYQGIVAATGVESKDFEEVLIKLESAQAILNGVMAIRNAIFEQSKIKTVALEAVERIRGFVIDATTGKVKALNVAMLATVGGAIIAGIVLLIANWDKLKNAIGGVSKEQEFNKKITEAAIETAAEEISSLDTRLNRINALTIGDKERTKQIKELQDEYPGYLGNLDAENVTTADLTANVNKLKDAYLLSAKAKAAQDLISEKFKEKLTIENQAIEENLSFLDQVAVGASITFEGAQEAQNTAFERAKASRDENLQAIDKDIATLNNQLGQFNAELDKSGGDPTVANEKYEKRQKDREAANKKAAEEQKRAQAELLKNQQKFNDDLDAIFADADAAYIESLSGEDKVIAQLAANDDVIEAQREGLLAQLDQLQLSAEERAQKEQAIESTFAQIRADNLRKANIELATIRAEDAAQLAEQTLQSLDNQESILLAEQETRLNQQKSAFATEEEFENAKQQALLAIQIEFAKKRLSLLTGDLTEEQKVQKAQLENTVSELTNTLNEAIEASNKKLNTGTDGFLMELFGVDEAGLGSLKDGLANLGKELTSFLSGMLSQQIAASERKVALLDDEIAKQQEVLDEEKALREQGYASSVEDEKNRLTELNKKREESLREQEKLRKRQALLETAQQAGALISSSANIYKALSPFGPVGIGIAIGTISLMLASFVATKVKAAQASATQLRTGATGDKHGLVRGRMHEQGGENFLDHVEVEDGEKWGVLSRNATKKYGKEFAEMVEAMNGGNFKRPGIRIPAFMNIVQSPEFEDMKKGSSNKVITEMRDELRMLREEVNSFKRQEGAKSESWTEGSTTIIRKGAHVKKFTVKD